MPQSTMFTQEIPTPPAFLSYSLLPLRSGSVRAMALRLILLVSAIMGACLAAGSPLRAQTLTVLHSFADGTVANDGNLPEAALVQGTDGNFYGTTTEGGSAYLGTMFKITPAGAITILHNFHDGTVANDGSEPQAALVHGTDGNFYGTTYEGGSAGHGTVFKITPAGAVTILHSFHDGTVANDGELPEAALVQGTDGNFYGTTPYGGSTAANGSVGYGTVFKITPSGAITIFHDFSDGTIINDGTYPRGLVQGTDGNFYGTTYQGGSAGEGAAFKMTPAGTVTILHSFNDGTVMNDGESPQAALVQGTDGNFFGTTAGGGSTVAIDPEGFGDGILFKMTPSGSMTVLHNFNDGTVPNDGIHPEAALLQGTDGNFYGTTVNGGATEVHMGNMGSGTVFKITPAGAVTILHSFLDGTDGKNPFDALVQGTDGSFYGTTLYGGSAGDGTVFKFSVASSSPTWIAHDTAAAPDGTARLLWTRSDGVAGIWIMNASNQQSAVGPDYGPYAGWTAKAVSVAGDGTSRVLWTNPNGEAGVWTFNAQGTETTVGPTYGPYTGWMATDIATASNGTSRVLWTNTNGQAGVWTFSNADVEITIGTTYGPYSGWTAKAVSAAGDGTARVLWTNTNGEAGVWSFSAADVETVIGKTYGPYTGWSAAGLGTSSDGTSNVLWTNTNGMAGVWSFSAADAETAIGTTYGPYSGYTAAALDAANDQSRVLWVNTSRAAGLWTFGANDAESVIGTTYGPF